MWQCMEGRGEGFGQDVIELGTGRKLFAELDGLGGEFLVAHRLERGFKGIDLLYDTVQRLDVAIVRRPEYGFD